VKCGNENDETFDEFVRRGGVRGPEPYSEEPLREYSFGDFAIDPGRRVLRCRGETVTLRPQSFSVLVYLIKRSGRLVTKAELISAVWSDTAVTDNSLAQCIVEIRRALDDDPQHLIRTIPRRGYLFAADATAPVMEFPPQQTPVPTEARPFAVKQAEPARKLIGWQGWPVTALVLAAFTLGGLTVLQLLQLTSPSYREMTFTQITNFTDLAVAPALSPDGRMVAFYRSSSWFLTPDQIYVKLLPNGEPV